MRITEKIELLRQCEKYLKEIIVLCHKELEIAEQIEVYPDNELLIEQLRETVKRKAELQKQLNLLQKKII